MVAVLNKVFIVDDEPYVLEGLKIMVDWEQYGFELCGEASNGEEAYELITRLKPDVIFTDIQMPYLNGLELIRRTIEQLKAIPKFVILSGYTDFRYVQSAIRYKVSQYLCKPIIVEEVVDVLVKLREELDHERDHRLIDNASKIIASAHAVSKWIHGEAYEIIPIGIADWLGIREQSSYMIVLVELELEEEGNKGSILKLLNEQIGTQLIPRLSTFNRCVLFNESEDRIGILAIDANWSNNGMEYELSQFAEWMKSTWELNISFYMSCTAQGVNQLNKLYKQALQTRMNRMTASSAGIFTYIQSIANPNMRHSMNTHIALLMELIKQVDTVGIQERIDRLLIELVSNGVSPDEITSYYTTIHAQLLEITLQCDSTIESDWLRSPISLEELKPQQMKQHLIDQCLETTKLIEQVKLKSYGHPTLHELIAYVKLHFNEKLTLQKLACQFQFNPIYLGQLFKKQMGTTFNDYLHQLRIKESKKLLLTTDMKIADIAKTIGYPNSDYFVGIFKAKMKCLPSTFRKRKL